MTSNNADLIPPPLRDRARVFHLAGLKSDEAVAVFERMTQCSDDRSGQPDCRAFIKRMAARPEGISLRQIRYLADAVTAPRRPLAHWHDVGSDFPGPTVSHDLRARPVGVFITDPFCRCGA